MISSDRDVAVLKIPLDIGSPPFDCSTISAVWHDLRTLQSYSFDSPRQAQGGGPGAQLTSLIEDGLRRVVDEQPKPAKRRVVLRVSKATGGLRPGIDPTKLATIAQEMEDLEYVGKSRSSRRGRRRGTGCTQSEPVARHSSQPSALGVTARIVSR